MKRILVVVFFLIAVSEFAAGQTLTMYRSFGGARFEKDSINLTHRQLRELLSIDPQATEEFKIATKNYRIGGVLGFSGALLVAGPLVNSALGGDPEWLLAGGGAVMLLASIPFNRAYKSHAEAAIDGYNVRHPLGTSRKVKFYFAGNEVGLRF